MTTHLKDFGNKVKTIRNELGLSQEELANKIGYKTKGSIARIENGERDLPIDKLKLIATALNTTPEYLVGWDKQSKQGNSNDKNINRKNVILQKLKTLNETQKERLEAFLSSNNIMYFGGKGSNDEETNETIKQALTSAFIEILEKKGEL